MTDGAVVEFYVAFQGSVFGAVHEEKIPRFARNFTRRPNSAQKWRMSGTNTDTTRTQNSDMLLKKNAQTISLHLLRR